MTLRNSIAIFAAVGLLAAIAACSDDEKPQEVLEEEMYVLNEGSNTISVYSVPGLERHGADIATPSPAPHHLHFDHSHIFYFVVSRTQGGFVHKYDASNNQYLTSSTLARFFTGVATDPDAQHVYVTDFGTDISQRTKTYILHVQDLQVIDSITCGSRPHFISMTSDGGTVIIANAGSDEMTLYYPDADPDDNVTNIKIDPDSAAPFGQPVYEPYCVVVADDDSLAYVCCRKSKVADKATIFVFDIPRRMTIDTLYLPYVNRSGAATNYRLGLCMLLEDGRYLAVTSQDQNSLFLVDLINGGHNEVVFQHNVTFGVTSTSDEKYLYVTANNRSLAPGWVYEIERTGGTLVVNDSVQVSMLPNGIHVKPGAHHHDQ